MSDALVPVTLQPEHVEFVRLRVANISEEVAHGLRGGVEGDTKATLQRIETQAYAICSVLNEAPRQGARRTAAVVRRVLSSNHVVPAEP